MKYSFVITQSILHSKLSNSDLEDFELNFENPDFEITSDLGKVSLETKLVEMDVSNKSGLEAVRKVLVILDVDDKNKKFAKALKEEDLLSDDGQLEAERFARYFMGGWEGTYISEDIVDFGTNHFELQ